MHNKVIILDIDGTLTRELSIWEYLLKHYNKWYPYGKDNLDKYIKKEIDYYQFCQKDASLFTGISYDELEKVSFSVPMNRNLDAFFNFLQKEEYKVCILSTGLKPLINFFLKKYNISFYQVNDLQVDINNKCTGRAIVNISDYQKGSYIPIIKYIFNSSKIIALGDSGGDIDVFKQSDFSIAINSNNEDLKTLSNLSLKLDDFSIVIEILKNQT